MTVIWIVSVIVISTVWHGTVMVPVEWPSTRAMIAIVLNSASSFCSSCGVTNLRWAKRSWSLLMAATIGATLPWICDFAVASCGWTLAGAWELGTALVTCGPQGGV